MASGIKLSLTLGERGEQSTTVGLPQFCSISAGQQAPPGAAACVCYVWRWDSEPSRQLPLGLSLKSNVPLRSLSHEHALNDSSSLLHRPQNSARARYEKQTRTKAFRGLQQNAKLRKAGMRAHEGDCNIKRLKLPQGAHKN